MTTGTFSFEWANPKTDNLPVSAAATISGAPRTGHPRITALETEIFVPSSITQGRQIVVEGLDSGDSYRYDESRQTLFIVARDTNPDKIHKVAVSVSPPLTPDFELNDFWTDFGGRVVVLILMVLLSIVALII
jgi:hypothetical protein